MFNQGFLFLCLLLSVSIALGQPSETADFNHRSAAMGGCEATIDGEGNRINIFEMSGGENPAGSHFNTRYGYQPGTEDSLSLVDKFSFDMGFRYLEYPGAPEDNGDKRSWYWIDSPGRILVEKAFNEFFSSRFQFSGGYNTVRKSWQDVYAPYPPEYRHNYTASTIDWGSLRNRAATLGGTALLPLGELYFSYHFPLGISVGAGGGYGFSEFEDMYYLGSWHTITSGMANSYRVRFGARYSLPGFERYATVGLSYGVSGGRANNEEDEEFEMLKSSESRLGIQAVGSFPGYISGGIAFESAKFDEDYRINASSEDIDELKDDWTKTKAALRVYGNEIGVPISLGVRYKGINTEGSRPQLVGTLYPSISGADDITVSENDLGIGITVNPIEWMTFAAEYNHGSWEYISTGDNNYEANDDCGGFSFGAELFPIPQFGVRFGFEHFAHETDSGYKDLSSDLYYHEFNLPYGAPMMRFDLVPDIEKGSILSGGFVLRLDTEQRLLVELTGRHYFSGDPEIYKEEGGNRSEGYLGLTYYLR